MKSNLLKFAKSMRRQATDAEAALWRELRANRFAGFKFKRQQPMGSYIADFVCFERKLVVEVDGGHHDEGVDHARTLWLEQGGFTVLRFWNNDVLGRKARVLEAILMALEGVAPSPQPLPHKGGGAEAEPAFDLSSRGRGRREAPGEGA